MNGMHRKHFHRGTLLMVEHVTRWKNGLMRDVLWREIFVLKGFFSRAFEGAVSAHFL